MINYNAKKEVYKQETLVAAINKVRSDVRNINSASAYFHILWRVRDFSY